MMVILSFDFFDMLESHTEKLGKFLFQAWFLIKKKNGELICVE
jgi:hypothetical protein